MDEETDIRRIIPPSPEDEACFDQVKSWLTACSTHSSCPNVNNVPLPPRIFEISPDFPNGGKLVESSGKRSQYLVLSEDYPAIEETITDIQQHNATTTLPKHIQDAILITQRLGYHYIWIPSLCTDPSNPPELASIYGNATLMLTTPNPNRILNERKVFYSPALGKNKDRFMRQKLLRWEDGLKSSSSEPSGWKALQRILAARVVHYTEKQMIWECAEGLKFEASGIPDKKTGAGQVRMRYRKGFVQPFITDYLQQEESVAPNSEEEEVGPPQLDNLSNPLQDLATSTSCHTQQTQRHQKEIHTRLEAYHQTLNELSTHSFPSPTSKLHALSTVARILNTNKNKNNTNKNDNILGPYTSGILTSHLATSLSWSRVYPILTPTSTYIAPTFSPLSIDGPISSLFLDWSPSLFTSHLENASFIEKYKPRLVKQEFFLVNQNDPYSAAEPGSSITISTTATNLMTLLTKVQTDEDQVFHPTLVLDRDEVLDCRVCAGYGDEDGKEGEDAITAREERGKRAQREMEGYLVCFLQGGFWGAKRNRVVVDGTRTGGRGEGGEGENGIGREAAEGVVDCVVLSKRGLHEHKHGHDNGKLSVGDAIRGAHTGDAETADDGAAEANQGYERVGFLRLSLDFHYKPIYERGDGSFDREIVEERFGALGWERMDLKLF